LADSTVPDIWKKGNWCPVFKHSDPHSKSNYRPIALLPCMSKVLEKIIFNNMYSFFMDNNLLTEKNSGFKLLDSTTNQLIHIVNKIYKSLEDGKDVCMVFLDVSKAFDRVDHHALLLKLQQVGICGNLLKWIESYLTDRSQRVIINGTCSDWIKINAGVPQGSILGPLLFLVYVTDIVENIESDINLFADDTFIMDLINKDFPLLAFDKIERDLSRLVEWAAQWRVTFNELKTVYMIVSKKKQQQHYPDITMNNTVLKKVTSHTHLGLTLNDSLTWDDHIERITSKASSRVGCLKRIRSLLPRSTLETLYKSMVRPVLEYGSTIFDNLPIKLNARLENIQRSAALTCSGAMQRTNRANLLKELGWDTLQERRKYFRLSLFFKMTHGMAPGYLRNLVPITVGQQNRYPLRNAEDIMRVQCRTQYHAKSFLPQTIKDWNSLSLELRNSTSFETFKRRYKKTNFTEKNVLFSIEFNESHKHHTRLRLNFSQLSQHLYTFNIIDSPVCQFCTLRDESTRHYFLECPTFSIQRITLFNKLVNILPLDILMNKTDQNFIMLFLEGDPNLPLNLNKKLFEAVQQFIFDSKRFKPIT